MENFWDDTAESYDPRHKTPRIAYIREREVEAIKKFSRGKILDLGCGTGFGMLQLGNFDAVGVDSSLASLLILKKKLPAAKVVLADCSRLPFKERCFETVVSTLSLINYVENPDDVLDEVNRAASENAMLVFSVAGHWDMGFFERTKLKNSKREKNMKIEKRKLKTLLYGFDEIVALFKKSGFRLKYPEGAFIFVEMLWGNLAPLTTSEKILLAFERKLKKILAPFGGIYILVFTK